MLKGIAYFVTYGIVSAILWALFLQHLEGHIKTIVGFVVGVGVAGLLTVLIRQGSFMEAVTSSAIRRITMIIILAILPTLVMAILGQFVPIPQNQEELDRINCQTRFAKVTEEDLRDPTFGDLTAAGRADCIDRGYIS